MDVQIQETRLKILKRENKLASKNMIIHEADNCIFESVFTDSLGKPADNAALMRKIEWLSKVGEHNIQYGMENSIQEV